MIAGILGIPPETSRVECAGAQRWWMSALLLLLLGTPALAPDAAAATRIEGRVLDAGSGEPLAFANVVISGTRIGTISQDDGTFFIEGIDPGEVTVVVTFIGYEPAEETIQLNEDEPVRLAFRLRETIAGTIDPIQIRAERPVIDVSKTSTSHTLHAQELQSLITEAPTIDHVVAQQPGVVKEQGRLHFRGGRADENLFVVDGVKVRDVLSGESEGSEIAVRSARKVDVVTGGFSAQYSQAMSGVIDTQLKEGTRRWHGAMTYESDILFDERNVHNIHTEVSGPNIIATPILRLLGADQPDVTFYGSLSCDLADGAGSYVPAEPGGKTLNSSVRDRVFGQDFRYGRFFYPYGSNRWRAVVKSAWRADAANKFSFTWTKSLNFTHDWGSADIGDIDRNVNRFPWSWSKHLDGHYTDNRDVNILSLNWNRTLGLKTRTDLRLWRHYSGRRRDVAGKHYSEYDDRRDVEMLDVAGFEDTPYFIDVGDAGDWRDRYAVVWGAANTWNVQLGTHSLEAGLSAEYHDVQYMALDANSVYIDPYTEDGDDSRPLGNAFDLFHVTPSVGNLYVQDSFEHEGMAVNLGLTYDVSFPGRQVERALDAMERPHFTPELRQKYYEETHEAFGHRYKGHLSPRVGVSFPIHDRAHLFFNYGHYSQRPPYYYVYAKSSSQSGEEYPRIGNPTLNPQISVSYEIGTGYQFTEATAAKATLFWRDMYDYPTSIRLVMKERTTSRSNFFMYWNMDYARSRGIELSLLRKRENFISGALSYTYSVARGKSSDPNKTKLIQETGGDSRETSLGEEFLWWNRPHKFTARLNLRIKENEQAPKWFGFRLPGDFSLGISYMIRSGRPYTPVNALGDAVGGDYSRNGPYDSTFDLSATKGFRLGDKRFQLNFNVYNLFDYRTPQVFDYVTGKPYEPGKGSLVLPTDDPSNYPAYLEEAIQWAVVHEITTWIEEYADTNGSPPTDDEILTYVEENLEAIRESVTPGVQEYVNKEFQARYYELSNPSYFGTPRTFRLGISYEW